MPAQHAKSIALTAEWDRWVDALVAAGEYKSASEVMRDGLRALRDGRERHQANLMEIRVRIDKALDQADRGVFAQGSGEDAVRRAFDTACNKTTS